MTITPAAQRYESLDVLRGVAVLGILMVNIQLFAMPVDAAENPSSFGSVEGAEGLIWQVTQVFFSGKFYTTFSALFGAGLLLFLGDDPNEERLAAHRRRMGWLLAIGMIHNYVFWYGDILTPYAVLGFILVAARNMSTRGLFVLGGSLVLGMSLVVATLMMSNAALMSMMSAEEYEAMTQDVPLLIFSDSQAALTAPWHERIVHMAPAGVLFQIVGLLVIGPKLAGIMLVGMALFRSGFFMLRWSAVRYLIAGVVCAGAATGLLWLLAGNVRASDFDPTALGVTLAANEPLSAIAAFGYGCLVMAACKAPWLAILRLPFASAGRMAFSCYLGTTAICVFLFFGPPGLSWFGADRMQQLYVVLSVWAGLLAFSTLWLTFFRFGPMEWLWRSLTYGRAQPLLGRARR